MNEVICPSANYPPMKWIRLPVKERLVNNHYLWKEKFL